MSASLLDLALKRFYIKSTLNRFYMYIYIYYNTHLYTRHLHGVDKREYLVCHLYTRKVYLQYIPSKSKLTEEYPERMLGPVGENGD